MPSELTKPRNRDIWVPSCTILRKYDSAACMWYQLNTAQNGRNFLDDTFSCTFVNKTFCILMEFHWSLFVIVNWQHPTIGLHNALAPNRCQPIIWINADPIHWRIYVPLGGDELNIRHCKLQGSLNNGVMPYFLQSNHAFHEDHLQRKYNILTYTRLTLDPGTALATFLNISLFWR